MTLHLQTGPGHHEKILIGFLRDHQLDFTYSSYHPGYSLTHVSVNTISSSGSPIYDFVKWLVWGVSHKLKFLRKRNKHLIVTYSLYDYISSRRAADAQLIFGWAQVSKISFRKVKKKGGTAILDYPIPHILKWQQILEEEETLLKVKNTHSKFSRMMVTRMLDEISTADYISVPSEFVRNSFLEFGVPASKLIFNSYGIDTDFFIPPTKGNRNEGKFKIVFVGSIEIRKGVHYLLEMFSMLDRTDAELRLVGTLHQDMKDFFNRYRHIKNVCWLGQLTKEATLQELQTADIMVMPSLAEGLSLTILESMACETPVISTLNAGGLGIIEDGTDGFLIPVRNVEAMREKVVWCMQNREKLPTIGQNARKKIVNGYRKVDYGNRFMELILSKGHEDGLAK